MRIVELQSELAIHLLLDKCIDMGLHVNQEGLPQTRIRVDCEDENAASLKRVVLNFILTDWLYAAIEKRLQTLHPYLTDDEREYVALLAFHSLRKEEDPIAGLTVKEWGQRLEESIHELAEQGSPIIIDGVVRFRLREYLVAVDSLLHELVEQFLTDREYEEFVSMLRYILDTQPASKQVLHVYCTEDLVWISDEQGNLIRDHDVTNAAYQVSDDEDVNAEDLAMSILITRSPCSIVIHDAAKGAPWPSFAETVERVFLQRATRCNGCTTCSELERANEGSLASKDDGASNSWLIPGRE